MSYGTFTYAFAGAGAPQRMAAELFKRAAGVDMLHVPTAGEAGLPGFVVSSMFGVLAPANTPKEIVDKLNGELVKILQVPEVKEQLLQQGAYAMSTSPQQTAERIKQEVGMWATVVQEAKITGDQERSSPGPATLASRRDGLVHACAIGGSLAKRFPFARAE